MNPGIQPAMLRSELEEVVGSSHISTRESDRLVYSTDWFWLPQMWLDRGEQLRKPDYIVHPGSSAEVAEILKTAKNDRYRFHGEAFAWQGATREQPGRAVMRAPRARRGASGSPRAPGWGSGRSPV